MAMPPAINTLTETVISIDGKGILGKEAAVSIHEKVSVMLMNARPPVVFVVGETVKGIAESFWPLFLGAKMRKIMAEADAAVEPSQVPDLTGENYFRFVYKAFPSEILDQDEARRSGVQHKFVRFLDPWSNYCGHQEMILRPNQRNDDVVINYHRKALAGALTKALATVGVS